MAKLICFVLLVIAYLSLGDTRSYARTWTDRAGRQVEAEFLGLADGSVEIQRTSDGKIFKWPLDRFSDADQAFVRSQAAGNLESTRDTETPASPPSSKPERSTFEAPQNSLSHPAAGAGMTVGPWELRIESFRIEESYYSSSLLSGQLYVVPKPPLDRIAVVTLAGSSSSRQYSPDEESKIRAAFKDSGEFALRLHKAYHGDPLNKVGPFLIDAAFDLTGFSINTQERTTTKCQLIKSEEGSREVIARDKDGRTVIRSIVFPETERRTFKMTAVFGCRTNQNAFVLTFSPWAGMADRATARITLVDGRAPRIEYGKSVKPETN